MKKNQKKVFVLLLLSLAISAPATGSEQNNTLFEIEIFRSKKLPVFTLTIGENCAEALFSFDASLWLPALGGLHLSSITDTWTGKPVEHRLNALLVPRPKRDGPGPGYRAFMANLALMAVSTANYWFIQQKTMQVDWDYRPTWSDQKKRFLGFSAWRFDNNYFGVNWTHAPAGALYYSLARNNSLNAGQSFLYSLAASFFWEYVSEFREVISINDQVFTPFAGFSIGENFFQISEMLRAKNGGFVAELLSWVCNFPGRLNDLFWGRKSILTNPPRFAATEDIFGTGLRLAGGWQATGSGRGLWLGGESRMITIPEYGLPGRQSKWLRQNSISEMNFDLVLAPTGNLEFSASTIVAYLGYFNKNTTADDSSGAKGISFYLGPFSGFDLSLQKYRDFTDRMAVVHLFGPLADVVFSNGDFSLHGRLDLSLHFSMIEALALADFARNNDLSGAKTPLVEQGYYFAAGFGARASLAWRWRSLEIGAAWRHLDFNSLQGRDRFQESIYNDFPLRDSARNWSLRFIWHIKAAPLHFFLSWERFIRSGWIAETSAHGRRDRLVAGFGSFF